MSDLIKRKPLLNWLRNYQFENYAEVGHEREYNFIENLIKGIENEPTVEAVSLENVAKLENPYSPFKYNEAFAGFETAKHQLIAKYRNKNKHEEIIACGEQITKGFCDALESFKEHSFSMKKSVQEAVDAINNLERGIK